MRSPASNVETFGGRSENSKNENRFIVIVVVVAVAAAAVAVVVVLVVIAVLIVVVSRACANTLLWFPLRGIATGFFVRLHV